MTPLATFLAESMLKDKFEVRLKGGALFKRATQAEMLAMIAMKAITPKKLDNGKVAYWVLTGKVARVRMALKAQRGRLDAEANHTVQRGAGGYEHVARICEGYGLRAA